MMFPETEFIIDTIEITPKSLQRYINLNLYLNLGKLLVIVSTNIPKTITRKANIIKIKQERKTPTGI